MNRKNNAIPVLAEGIKQLELKSELRDFLQANMTVSDFNNLPVILDVSEKKLTRLLNFTDSWNSDLIKKLIYFLCQKGYYPNLPIEEFCLKYNFTQLSYVDYKHLNLMFVQLAGDIH